ncbi:hypothetical protein PV325_010147 [Microctonus aethiopoides]|nr:hypothetical protein PV325_010147 [Microctonus aethiopoides]
MYCITTICLSRGEETGVGKIVSRYRKEASRCQITLAMNNARAGFVVFLLGDPHLLEGGQGSKDGTTDPYGVFPFRWSNDLDFDG